MSELTCTATMSQEAIELDLGGKAISISLDGDIDFTPLAKYLTQLVERECSIAITWAEGEEGEDEPTDKENVAKEVVDEIIVSFNQVIEEQFDGEDESETSS